jgi:Na+/H+-dicarboxylate symporter
MENESENEESVNWNFLAFIFLGSAFATFNVVKKLHEADVINYFWSNVLMYIPCVLWCLAVLCLILFVNHEVQNENP